MSYVMVIEDDEFYGKIFKNKIKEAGLPVECFLSADEAYDQAIIKTPKLIVTDLVMPKMDGFKFIELVKKTDSLKEIPILVFSNLGQEKDMAEAKRLGANDYIIKNEISLSEAMEKIIGYYSKFS